MPYLVYRDADRAQVIVRLDGSTQRLTIGRSEANDVSLPWDGGVSRVHAAIERMADGWTLADEGLSRNGSFVNHERIQGRRLLTDGDALRFGDTVLGFRDPVAA